MEDNGGVRWEEGRGWWWRDVYEDGIYRGAVYYLFNYEDPGLFFFFCFFFFSLFDTLSRFVVFIFFAVTLVYVVYFFWWVNLRPTFFTLPRALILGCMIQWVSMLMCLGYQTRPGFDGGNREGAGAEGRGSAV